MLTFFSKFPGQSNGHVNVGTLSRILERGQQLPEAYRWSPSDEEPLEDDGQQQLPVIDLSQAESGDDGIVASMSQRIRSACQDWGAFQVVNHGVEEQIVDKVRNKSQHLFALPEAEKSRAERQPGSLFGYGATRMASFFNRLMWSEAFTMMGSPNSNIQEYASRLCMSADFCSSFHEYDRAMRKLSLLVIRLILQGLDASCDQVANNFCGMIHMNYYPPCPNPLEAMGLAAHTDSSCLTIMHQGNVPGLQVKRGNTWIPVKPIPSAFVVQVGDMLQVMSNNAFKSVIHRALVNDSFTRLSLVYFFAPPPNATISPIVPGRPLYRCLTWNEYLQTKAKLFMGALDHFLLH